MSALAVAACGGDAPDASRRADVVERANAEGAHRGPAPAGGSGTDASAARLDAAQDPRPRVVVLGDSLTAGLGLEPAEAYPTLLQQKLDAAGLDYRVVNAGVSGDTSAGGLSRLDLALEGDVRVLIVALGGNDALRALPPDSLRKNLSTIVERAQADGATVLLAGMEAPPNFGQDYVEAFRAVYGDVARQYKVALLPFLLDGVAGIDGLNQRDGIHPTAEGARVIADRMWPVLEPLVRGDARRAAHQ
ncbi:MAG: arylesterase [Vicinamibacterales bacterium]